MDYKKIITDFIEECKQRGKSPVKNFHKIQNHDDVLNYLKTKFSTSKINVMLYCEVNNLPEVPKAPCNKNIRIDTNTIRNCCDDYKSTEPNSCIVCHDYLRKFRNKQREKSNLAKYGVKYTSQLQSTKDKHKSNIKEKYNVDNISQIESVKVKKLEIYNKNKEQIIANHRCTIKEKYNVDNISQIESVKIKKEKLCTELYGVNNYFKSEEFKNSNTVNTTKHRYESIIQYLKDQGKDYQITFIPFGYKELHKFVCNECNSEFECYIQSFNTIRCLNCSPYNVSSGEQELRSYIESVYNGNIIYNHRINMKEIDIYLPDLKVGFEFNGAYWHSSRFKDKNYHFDKKMLGIENGINIINIHEDLWYNKNDIVKNRILSYIKNDTSIYARNCTVNLLKNVDSFLNSNHIQGTCKSKINLGLMYNNEIYAVMTFGKPRFNNNYEYELIRYCSKGTVVGGASKLLKYFERNYNPKSIISYADMDWSTGEVYKKLNFEFDSYTKCGYFYVYKKQRLSRYQCQKHKLLLKYPEFDKSHTEDEICLKLGYNKIYNTGNMVFYKTY